MNIYYLLTFNNMVIIITNIINTFLFIFLGVITLKNNQYEKKNWALFYGFLYTLIVLPFINYSYVTNGFWNYKDTNLIKIPLDLYFMWTIIWGVFPFYFFKGKYSLIIALFLFWFDLLMMPFLEKHHILTLNKNWIYGEIIMILFVFLPSYLWTKISFKNKHTWLRALFQVTIMSLFFLIILPFTLNVYGLIKNLSFRFSFTELQLFFIVTFPALIAVSDLVSKGKGTPFPYDKTQHLVQTGVYAYCKNPIQ